MDNDRGHQLVRSHNASRGILGKEKHGAYIEIDDSADGVLQDLDEIIITFTFVWMRDLHDKGRG